MRNLLIIGITLLITGFIGPFLTMANPISQSFNDLPLSTFYLVLLIIFVAPLVEEYLFRFIAKKSNRLQVIWSFVLALLVFAISQNVTILILLIILAFIPKILNKWIKTNQQFAYVILSSVAFGFAHFGTTDFNLFGFLSLTGLGVLLSFLRIKFSILASIIGHAIWNTFAVLLMFYSSPNLIVSDNATLKRNSTFSLHDYSRQILESRDTFHINNASLSVIAQQVFKREKSNFSKLIFPNSVFKYSGFISKSNQSAADLGKTLNMNVDSASSIEMGYEVKIVNTATKSNSNIDYNLSPKFKIKRARVSSLINGFAVENSIPIKVNSSSMINDEVVTVQVPVQIDNIYEFTEIIYEETGIRLHLVEKSFEYKTYFYTN